MALIISNRGARQIFVVWAFIMSIVWIFLVADELVSLLNVRSDPCS